VIPSWPRLPSSRNYRPMLGHTLQSLQDCETFQAPVFGIAVRAHVLINAKRKQNSRGQNDQAELSRLKHKIKTENEEMIAWVLMA